MDVPHPEQAPAGLSRRSLVKRGLLGGALLAAGGAGFLALRGGNTVALPADGLLVFTPAQFAVLDAIARWIRWGWPGPRIASPRRWSRAPRRSSSSCSGSSRTGSPGSSSEAGHAPS